LEDHQKGKEKHSALCNINDGLCGECMQNFHEWEENFEAARKPLQQREREALDKCIIEHILYFFYIFDLFIYLF
jgi:hypothetical protein